MNLSSPKIKKFLILFNPKLKKPTLKKFLIFWEMELSNPKKLNKTLFILLIKLFYTANKTLLGETRCLSNLYYLQAAQASSLLIHPLF